MDADETKFSQEDVNRIVAERLAREKVKYDELAEKYNQLNRDFASTSLKVKDMEGQLQELPKLKRETIVNKVAREKQIPEFLVNRLSGETEEEVAKDADTLLAALQQDNNGKYKGLPKTPDGKGSPKKQGIELLLSSKEVINS